MWQKTGRSKKLKRWEKDGTSSPDAHDTSLVTGSSGLGCGAVRWSISRSQNSSELSFSGLLYFQYLIGPLLSVPGEEPNGWGIRRGGGDAPVLTLTDSL
jgi:hypothetical protein